MADESGAGRPMAKQEDAARLHGTPKRSSYDLIVIGGGSAGLSAAQLGAALGANVALLDRERLGGECLYTGCIPSKALLHVARVAAQIRRAGALGMGARLDSVDLGAVADHVQAVIGEVYVESDAPEHFIRIGMDVVLGAVRFISPKALTVNGHTITSRRFLICTGSHPAIPDLPGLREDGFLTNESVFDVRRLPASLAVVGGGPVGCELGQAFARLGSRVTIVQRRDRLLPREEPEASTVLRERLEAEGVTVVTRATARSVTMRNGLKVVAVAAEHGEMEVTADDVLVAVGRVPALDGLGLDAAGVRADAARGIGVDGYLRTSNPRIYAAGDVTGGYRFTHAAALEARTAVRNALIPIRSRLDERVMPWATFTEPAVARVGLTEAEARAAYGSEVRVFTQPLAGVDRAITDGETTGFVKLISTEKGKLLGATVVGPAASELINELALAMSQGIPLDKIAATTHVYPTIGLGIQQAAGKYSVGKLMRSRAVKLLRRLAR